MMRRYLFIFLNAVLSFSLSGQKNVLEIFDDDTFIHASAGMTIIDVSSDSIIFDYNGEKSLIPASSLKLITTFSALDILGEDFTFDTEIYHTGEILDGGTLLGDIVFKGSGDPTLGSHQFSPARSLDQTLQDSYAILRNEGITCVEGDIRIDRSAFIDNPINPTWQWSDISNYYAAGVWGFNIHENLFFLNFNRSEQPHTKTSVNSISPNIPGLTVKNMVTTGESGSGDNAYIFGDPLRPQIEVRGTIPPGKGSFRIKGAIPRPDIFFVHLFKKYLESKNIQCRPPFYERMDSEELILFGLLKSPRLSLIVKEANLESNNFYCESILKKIGQVESGRGSTHHGSSVVYKYLNKLGLNTKGFTYRDGSGLSAKNRINTKLLANFLNYQAKRGAKFLSDHMAVAGENGTVKNLFNENNDYRIILKSGSLDQVLAYAGFIEIGDELFAFAFISNAHTCGNRQMRENFQSLIKGFIKFREIGNH